MLDIVHGLDPEGWFVDLACPPGSDPWLELAGRPGVALHRLCPGKEPQLSDAADLRHLARLAARADVVHAHASKAGFLSRLASVLRRRRGRTVFTPHGWSFWAHDERSGLWLRLERLAAHWCGAIVAVADAERRAGLAAGVGTETQYRVIRNGIDPARFERPRRPVRGRIALVGRLAEAKRPDIAIKALARLRQRHPEASLDVIADGPLDAEVAALVSELGVQDAVRLLGKRDDVPELLAEAECFLLTSDHEGCPYSVLEAMAAGLPVAATRVGGVPELVAERKTGVLFEPGDPDAAADALAGLLEAPDRARTLGEEGRARVRSEFGRERMVSQTVALYDALT